MWGSELKCFQGEFTVTAGLTQAGLALCEDAVIAEWWDVLLLQQDIHT